MRAQDILNEALRLSDEEKKFLVDELLATLPGEREREIEQSWKNEIERRTAAFERSEMRMIPAEEVFQSLRK